MLIAHHAVYWNWILKKFEWSNDPFLGLSDDDDNRLIYSEIILKSSITHFPLQSWIKKNIFQSISHAIPITIYHFSECYLFASIICSSYLKTISKRIFNFVFCPFLFINSSSSFNARDLCLYVLGICPWIVNCVKQIGKCRKKPSLLVGKNSNINKI